MGLPELPPVFADLEDRTRNSPLTRTKRLVRPMVRKGVSDNREDGGFMDTAVYYTCSTVAQVLASAFGFLVALALYRMESIRGSIRTHGARRGEIIKNMQRSATKVPDSLTQHYHANQKSEKEEGEKLKSIKLGVRQSSEQKVGLSRVRPGPGSLRPPGRAAVATRRGRRIPTTRMSIFPRS